MNFFLLFSIFVAIISGVFISFVIEGIVDWIKIRSKEKMLYATNSSLLTKKKKKSLFHKKLSHAGVTHPLSYLFTTLLIIDLLLGTLLYLFVSLPLVYFLSTLFTLFLFFQYLSFMRIQRISRFNKALAIMISLLVRMMRNGVGFDRAMEKAIEANSDKLFKEIMTQFLFQKKQLGEQKAFENLLEKIDSKELKIFTLAIKIGKESGGAFSNTLETLEKTLQERQKLQRFIDTKTQESKIGSYIILLLAIAIFFILDINFNGNITNYFFHTFKGKIAILLISMWVLFGVYINSVITRIER